MDRYYKIEDIGSRRSDLRKKAIFKGKIRLCFSGRLAFFLGIFHSAQELDVPMLAVTKQLIFWRPQRDRRLFLVFSLADSDDGYFDCRYQGQIILVQYCTGPCF